MKKKEIFLTGEGYLELENELNYLRNEKRKEVTQTLKDARALGDLSENSEYDQAREEQANLEKRILEIEYTLEHAKDEMEYLDKYVEVGLIDRLTKVLTCEFKRVPYKECIEIHYPQSFVFFV